GNRPRPKGASIGSAGTLRALAWHLSAQVLQALREPGSVTAFIRHVPSHRLSERRWSVDPPQQPVARRAVLRLAFAHGAQQRAIPVAGKQRWGRPHVGRPDGLAPKRLQLAAEVLEVFEVLAAKLRELGAAHRVTEARLGDLAGSQGAILQLEQLAEHLDQGLTLMSSHGSIPHWPFAGDRIQPMQACRCTRRASFEVLRPPICQQNPKCAKAQASPPGRPLLLPSRRRGNGSTIFQALDGSTHAIFAPGVTPWIRAFCRARRARASGRALTTRRAKRRPALARQIGPERRLALTLRPMPRRVSPSFTRPGIA